MSKRKEDPPVEPNLPVTPMLDMTFQLLTFFIFTYHPTALEGKMDFSLPASGDFKAKAPEEVEPKTSDTEVDLESELVVEIRTERGGEATTGNISQILIKSREGETPVTTLEALKQHLEKIRKDLPVENASNIKVSADSKLKWAFVIKVMDTCMAAGFDRVGFAAPPDLSTPE